MRILHTNCDYFGTSLHQNMFKHLNRIGVDGAVFSPVHSDKGANIRLSDNEKAIVCFNKIDRVVYPYKQRKIYKAFCECFENMRSASYYMDIDNFDILHAYYTFTDGNYTRKMALKHNKPYVVAVRDTDVNAFFAKAFWLRRYGVRVLRDASKVFFLSESYRQNVVEKYVPKSLKQAILEKSLIIPNGIDSFWIEQRYMNRDYASIENRLNNKELRLVFAGKIQRRKNIPAIIKVANMLEKEGWSVKLDVIGPICDKKIYKKIVESRVVRYTPKLPKEELIKKYREADIFIMLSHTETFGLVYAEAMSQGLPVIYTKGQGFDEQFEEGEVGYSASDKAVSEAVERIKDTVKNYEKISRRCISCVEKLVLFMLFLCSYDTFRKL